jgi:transposase
VLEHKANLRDGANLINYQNRTLFGKEMLINMNDIKLYAYLMLDMAQEQIDIINISNRYPRDKDGIQTINEQLPFAGKFILLSSDKYDKNEILPLYYMRQQIEQAFDISKIFAGLLPIRCHKEETINGTLLISFLSTIVYSMISYGLAESKLNAISAIVKMKKLQITDYITSKVIDERTKEQNEIFQHLQLECPFKEETGIIPKKESYIESLKVQNQKRDRPKGSKNKVDPALADLSTIDLTDIKTEKK